MKRLLCLLGRHTAHAPVRVDYGQGYALFECYRCGARETTTAGTDQFSDFFVHPKRWGWKDR